MLNAAGANSKLAAAKWLRQQGAEWPAVINWCGCSLDWAGSEGCTAEAPADTY
jgi:hypothetical protein